MAQEGRLIVIAGFVKEKSYILPKEADFTVGRDRHNSISVMSRRVSRDHAKITCQKGVYSVEDLNSKTGTIVNGRKIGRTILRHNDTVQIGDIKFKFETEEAKPPVPVAPPRPIITPPKPIQPPPPPKTAAPAEEAEVEVPAFSDDEVELVGKTLSGIKVIATLARGRRTVIFKGIQAEKNRIVALKLLMPEMSKKPEVKQWFVRGAEKAVAIRHEDTAYPLGGGRHENLMFIFTSFMENGSALQQFAKAPERGLGSVKLALESLVHVVRALEFGSAKGILHLGIRPSKVLLDEKRHAKLNGLGFDNTPDAPGATRTAEVMAYLAPEQLKQGGTLTFATDIFSLGATFYYMLTGQRPERDRRGRIGSPKQAAPGVPDSICRIVEKMVAVETDQRYTGYGQLLHDLRWALRGEAWPHA